MDKKCLLCSGLAFIASLCFLVPLFADEGQEGASGKRAPLIAPSGERIASSVPGGTLRFSRRETFSPNGSYLISVAQGDRWITAGEVLSDKYFRKMTIDLAGWVDSDEARIRIEQRGGGAAHLDCIALNGTAASNLEGFLARKLSKADYDVVDSYGKTFEIVFKGIQGKAPLVLELTGRVESETISKVPFQFPLDNMHTEMSAESAFYSYRLGSRPGRLTLDGELRPEALGEPFFEEFFPTGSGHPDAPVYGWIFDDGQTLYVAIDFLGDNTMDGGKDYTKVYVNTPEGLKEFEVTAEQMQWGRPGFTYTERTGWQHKVYEFAIPMSAIHADSKTDQSLQLAFAAYGTACPTGGVLEFVTDPNGVEPDSGASGTAFTFT
ncbi:MAG TPA: hypothetical protein VMX75_14650, partial [Spirochaetia bacterium]|nr:hypothetical protein [Spirochaetia bacterium]